MCTDFLGATYVPDDITSSYSVIVLCHFNRWIKSDILVTSSTYRAHPFPKASPSFVLDRRGLCSWPGGGNLHLHLSFSDLTEFTPLVNNVPIGTKPGVPCTQSVGL